MRRPSSGTLEELLRQIEGVLPASQTFDIWVPHHLTHAGEPVSLEAAMAVVVDQLLARGMLPDGFDQEMNGRTYHYRREAESEPQLPAARAADRNLFQLLRAVGIGSKPEARIGQVWHYATRRGEEESRVVVLKIEDEASVGTIVHVAINGVHIERSGSATVTELPHIPVSKAAFENSVLSVESQLERLPDFAGGYRIWRTAFETGQAGVFSLSIAEIVDVMEATLEDGAG